MLLIINNGYSFFIRLSMISLHDRRFMSQAGERSISRKARDEREARDEGEGKNKVKNKAPVDSPLFWLFHKSSTVHLVDGNADWSIYTT